MATNYENQLGELYNTYDRSLEEVTNSYSNNKLNPGSNDYKKDVNNFNSVKSNIYKLQNNLQKDVDDTENNLIILNEQITLLNVENAALTNQYYRLNNQNNAAAGALVDQQFLYNELYAQNIALVCLIIANIGLYSYKTYK